MKDWNPYIASVTAFRMSKKRLPQKGLFNDISGVSEVANEDNVNKLTNIAFLGNPVFLTPQDF